MAEFLDYLDLSQNELRNARIQNLSSAPANPVEGQEYYDSTLHVLFYYNGTTWVEQDGRTAVPEGPAGGDLAGTYPNPALATGSVTTPKLADGAVTGTKVDASLKDASGSTPSMRTLGTGANQATAGNDIRLTDQRTPLDASVTDAKVSPTAAISLSKLAVDPLARANHTGTQLSATISDFDQSVRTSRLDQMARPTTVMDNNGQRYQNLADPVNAQDAATKAYVDAGVQGLDVKASVRVATTGNITLSGLQTIDGINLAAGDSALVKNQTAGRENGIYTVAAGAWARRADFDTSAKVTPGAFTFVEEGATQADAGWVLTTDGAVQLGTTALSFVQFSGAGQIDAGAGMTKSGNQLNVVGTTARVQVNSDNIDIDPGYIGQTSITTVGTVTAGTWNATTIDVAHGGTGATNAVAARSSLGATGKFAKTLDGGATSEVITHNLNSQDVIVQARRVAAPYSTVQMTVEMTSANTVTVRSSLPIPANTYRVIVLG